MQTYLSVAQIVLSLALILTILLQVRSGGLGGIFGQSSSVFRTKRGVERILFQFTIVLAVLFVVISIVMLRIK